VLCWWHQGLTINVKEFNDDIFAIANCELLEFELAPALEAGEAFEARGLDHDQVRLMVSYYTDDRVVHVRFRQILDFLNPGDVLVIPNQWHA